MHLNPSSFFSLVVVLALGCTMTPNHQSNSESIQVLQGGLSIIYKSSGEFESLTSTATAPVVSDLPSARDEAVTVATLRARKQISEFLNVEINSEQFTENLTNSVQESSEILGTRDKTVQGKIVTQLKETIQQKSSSILKGTNVESAVYDPTSKTVTVKVSTGTQSTTTSRTLKNLMK
jgi:hypothetical protein